MSQDSIEIPTPPLPDPAEIRLKKAVLLKDYAISRGITVSESILKLLNDAECAKERATYLCEKGLKIDQAISELTNFTYPTTGDTLMAVADPKQAAKVHAFRKELPRWLFAATAAFAIGYLMHRSTTRLDLNAAGALIEAAALGLLGTVMFQIFNTIGVMREKAFTVEDVYSNRLRLFIGPTIGILLLFIVNAEIMDAGKLGRLDVILPFLGGFSTKLVIGILDKMVQAVMLAFGIEDKRADVLVRQRRNQATAGSVPPGGGDDIGVTDPKEKVAEEDATKNQVTNTDQPDDSDASGVKDPEITNNANDAEAAEPEIEPANDEDSGTTNPANNQPAS